MTSTSTIVKCAKCSTVLDDAPDVPIEQRQPCPSCGSTARAFEDEILETVNIRESLGMKARRGPAGRPFYETKSGPDFHRTSARWMQRDLVIDRENDRYFERVIDPETGEVLRICEEPLSQHQGHGTARNKSIRIKERKSDSKKPQ